MAAVAPGWSREARSSCRGYRRWRLRSSAQLLCIRLRCIGRLCSQQRSTVSGNSHSLSRPLLHSLVDSSRVVLTLRNLDSLVGRIAQPNRVVTTAQSIDLRFQRTARQGCFADRLGLDTYEPATVYHHVLILCTADVVGSPGHLRDALRVSETDCKQIEKASLLYDVIGAAASAAGLIRDNLFDSAEPGAGIQADHLGLLPRHSDASSVIVART